MSIGYFQQLDEELGKRYPEDGDVPFSIRLMIVGTIIDMGDSWPAYRPELVSELILNLHRDQWYQHMAPVLRAIREQPPTTFFPWWAYPEFPWEQFTGDIPPDIQIRANIATLDGWNHLLRDLRYLRPGRLTKGPYPAAGYVVPHLSRKDVESIISGLDAVRKGFRGTIVDEARFNVTIESIVRKLRAFREYDSDWEVLGVVLYGDARELLQRWQSHIQGVGDVSITTTFPYIIENFRNLAKDAAGAVGEVIGGASQTFGEAFGRALKGFLGSTGFIGLAVVGAAAYFTLRR